MGQRYLIDTNAAIDFLDNKLPIKTINLIYNAEINISIITRMELLASPKATAKQLKTITKFIGASTVFNLDESIILSGIDIRKYSRIKLPDAIIAATAIVNSFSGYPERNRF